MKSKDYYSKALVVPKEKSPFFSIKAISFLLILLLTFFIGWRYININSIKDFITSHKRVKSANTKEPLPISEPLPTPLKIENNRKHSQAELQAIANEVVKKLKKQNAQKDKENKSLKKDELIIDNNQDSSKTLQTETASIEKDVPPPVTIAKEKIEPRKNSIIKPKPSKKSENYSLYEESKHELLIEENVPIIEEEIVQEETIEDFTTEDFTTENSIEENYLENKPIEEYNLEADYSFTNSNLIGEKDNLEELSIELEDSISITSDSYKDREADLY